ncbi:reverse transcriptase domain-containing protein, partial [Tanacetum coccineum]
WKSYDPPINLNDQQNESETPINFNSEDEDEESTPQPKSQTLKPVKETPIPKPYKPKIPYPQRLRKEKMEAQYGKFLDMIRAVRINVPLVVVLAGMPNYENFLKELISNKYKLEQISSTFLSDESFAMIQIKVPPKLGDPESFLIPCNFSKSFSCNALVDLGASINLMPYSLYAKLSLETLKPTKMSIRLADRSFQHPIGIAENMLVEVGKFTFPVDFVILEMEEDSKVPLILGRPFLYTVDVVIRVKHKQLNLGVEEDFDALLDEGSKILHSIEGTILEEKLFAEFDEFMAMTADENSESESNTEEPSFEKITFNTDYKIKTSLEEPPLDLELKPLPDNLEYVFLEKPSFLRNITIWKIMAFLKDTSLAATYLYAPRSTVHLKTSQAQKSKKQVFILIGRQVRRKEKAKAENAKKSVPFEQRDERHEQPRIVYSPIFDINYFRHFLDILENYNPMDDEPMWVADHVVAPTPGFTITIPETANEFTIKGSRISDTDKIMARMDAMTMKMDAQYKELQSRSKQPNPDHNDDDNPMSPEEETNFMQTFRPDKQSARPSRSLHSNTQPIPKAENRLIEVGKFTFLVNFVILEMEEDGKVPLILGRPFLHNVDAVIRVKQKQLNLRFEEYFDALFDEGSEILYSIEGTILKEKLFAEFDEFMAMNIEGNSESESDTKEPPFKKITFNTDYKIKTSLKAPPSDFELKPLPDNLEYMLAIFHDLIEESVEVFMDDFSVFGNSFDNCLNNLDKMIQHCKDANLVLNWEKCHFMVKEGIVLGHKVSSAGLEVDKAKIDVISKLPPPTNVKGIRSFLGQAGFYQRFIKDFLKITRPLTKFLEKDTSFEFNDDCHKAFNSLKEKLTCTPVMVSPNWNLPFEFMCDASDFAVRAVLGQKDENVAADHLSQIDNDETSDDSDVDDNFSGETLMEITTNDTP